MDILVRESLTVEDIPSVGVAATCQLWRKWLTYFIGHLGIILSPLFFLLQTGWPFARRKCGVEEVKNVRRRLEENRKKQEERKRRERRKAENYPVIELYYDRFLKLD